MDLHSRYNLVQQPTQEQDGHFDIGNVGIRRPDLMTQQRQILGGRHDFRDQLAHAEEGVLENDTINVPPVLVLGDELHGDSTPQTLPVYDQLVVLRFGAVAQIVEGGLRIQVEARLVGFAGGQAVPPIFRHKDVASCHGNQHAGNWQAVANIPRIAVKHDYRDIRVAAAARASNVVGRELLAIVRRDDELLEILEIVVNRTGHLGPRVGRDVRGIDQGPGGEREGLLASSSWWSREAPKGAGNQLLFKVQQRSENSGDSLWSNEVLALVGRTINVGGSPERGRQLAPSARRRGWRTSHSGTELERERRRVIQLKLLLGDACSLRCCSRAKGTAL